MKRPFYFLALGFILTFGVVHSQTKLVSSLNFHSALEEEVIIEFLQKKDVDLLELQLISSRDISASVLKAYNTRLDEFVKKLSEKRGKYKSDKQFLSYAFYKVNQKFLKRYKPFTSPALLFKTGEYDCLSGTTLYALILHRLGIEHDIVETNHHIYLRVQHENEVFLMESTDPMYGFIADQKEVANRLSYYNHGNSIREGENIANKEVYVFESQVNDNIDMFDLVGLHYYNAAINSFNQEDISSSIDNLEKAVVFYFSPRISEFGLLVAKTLLEVDQIQDEAKRDYLNRINNLLTTERSYAVR
ncbi:hypothetical protein JMN32_14125 [Fulvivirga sp. 29W222]|uniref:Uncharacterized protein n=1 Tax=Fulvivirga marina TaxID=2494733 RepID=A0A937KBV8_9BACT|nr:hypothetical protein [Fulvivirga marina]MBL6447451.1 hypothetical protein [Fulvivirga marina]